MSIREGYWEEKMRKEGIKQGRKKTKYFVK
jgi:hypothetical protein